MWCLEESVIPSIASLFFLFQEYANLLKHVQGLKTDILNNVKDFPEVSAKISFLFNLTFTSLLSNRSESPLQHTGPSHIAHRTDYVAVREDVRVQDPHHSDDDDQVLLSDDLMDLLMNDMSA